MLKPPTGIATIWMDVGKFANHKQLYWILDEEVETEAFECFNEDRASVVPSRNQTWQWKTPFLMVVLNIKGTKWLSDYHLYLVGGFNSSENISQLGLLVPIYGKIKSVPNHQPVYRWGISPCHFFDYRMVSPTKKCWVVNKRCWLYTVVFSH